MIRSIWFWILLLLAWIVFASFICKKYLCKPELKATVEKALPIAKPATQSAWVYNDGNDLNIKADQHFRFSRSGFTHLTPLSANLISSIGKTVNYLKDHPDRSLTITGLYNSDEENKSILPNLGLARANNISKYLTSLGVSTGQLVTASNLTAGKWIDENTLVKGADFAFGALEKADDRIALIKKRLFGKPITLYFGTGEKHINLSAQQRTDFADLIYYLDNVKASKLEISGHTDSVGNRNYNVNLSKERANFVSNYLNENGGISQTKTNSLGQGPNKPIGDNGTSKGRASNRRVEVTLR